MKDLGAAKQILGMKIIRDRKNGKLWLSQQKYIEKVLERFNMGNVKKVGTPLAGHFKLSKKQCPTSKIGKEEMKKVPYASVVGILPWEKILVDEKILTGIGLQSKEVCDAQ
ncbi:hypothetical protein L6164_036713 [Bauhinia variegata]|uniref:Uncharacterized protein n=1 Tax=Bauhinia variegata TaxID=167791 RepID=A0ACB9KHW4_BAUVA|nr:hypothetical protein L6164_036713 [Bauhinia variegata]